jgi:hypothetical protein
MILVFNIRGWHDHPDITTVNYGIGAATLSKVEYAYKGPDGADLSGLDGECVSDIEDQLSDLGFVAIDGREEVVSKMRKE